MNTQVEQLVGSASADLLGSDFLDLFPDSEKADVERSFDQARNGGHVKINTTIQSRNSDRLIPVLLRLIDYTDPHAQRVGMYAMMLDLSELVEALRKQESLAQRNKDLEDMVVTCPLTGIYNRRYFELRYAEEMSRARRYGHGLGFAMIDADNFKEINDKHGHQVGDAALKLVAHTLRDTIRTTDIVARYGGDEFVLVLPEVKPEGILPLAIRLRQQIQDNTVDSPSGPIGVTISIGLSCWMPDEEPVSEEELLRRADEALYLAKQSGRNRIVLYSHPIG
jgi:diguanylate cyclase (GGDEF)-like protein/PAS domain S-box-containing protein